MIFSKYSNMKLKFCTFAFILCISLVSAQRNAQRIAYIDMDYILKSVPEYLDAQNTLDAKVTKWRSELDKLTRYIEKLKTDLENEKAILTQDIIQEKEDEITLKQEELRRLESLYFGPNGDMFLLRKQLVKPVQDQVYNAIQNIASRRKYDFVFDKSSDFVMLYSNKKHDISDLVLNTIVRDRKVKERKKKKAEGGGAKKKELSEAQKNAIAAKEAAIKKKEADRAARKKKIEDARKKRLADIKAKRELLKKKKEDAKKKKEENKKEQDNN